MAAEVSFLRTDKPALPLVSARFVATVGSIALKDGAVKLTLEIDADLCDPQTVLDLARTQRDGSQTVVLVSQNRARPVPGTEEYIRTPDQQAMAERVAIGLQLHDDLVSALLEDRDPETGYIESDGPRTERAPLFPVGTRVGSTVEDADAAVRDRASVDPEGTAVAAGKAARRRRGV